MNYRLLFFAGMITAAIGAVLGLVLAALLPTPYTGALYQQQRSRFAIIGGLSGFIVGISQEGIRQLQEQSQDD